MKAPQTSIQYSIVIPVYNSSRGLHELQERISRVFSTKLGQAYEILLVEDGSPDPDTWPVVADLAQKHQQISAIRLSRNFGQHAALLCGLAHARGEFIITMDDDLQHAPEDIPALVKLQEHDVVIGQYFQKKHPPLRNLFSAVKSRFDRTLTGVPSNIRISTFCLFQRNIVQQMLRLGNMPYPLLSTLIFKVTQDVAGAPVGHSKRREGESGYTFFKLMRLFSRVLINNSGFSTSEKPPYLIQEQILHQ